MLEPRAVITFRLPQSLKDAMDKRAYELGISSSDAMRQAFAAWCGIDDPTVHGNTKYYKQEKRIAARREQTRQAVRKHRDSTGVKVSGKAKA